jgi:hypothetical protein
MAFRAVVIPGSCQSAVLKRRMLGAHHGELAERAIAKLI